MVADGGVIDVTAAFSDDGMCMFNEPNAGIAPDGANFSSACGAEVIFINEIHYDNAGGDMGEFIEVAGTAGVCLDDYEIHLYNGLGLQGNVYNVMSLSGNIDNEGGTGFGAVAFQYPVNGIQNGSPDGMALVRNGCVLEFLSYEGEFTAVSGPAVDLCSVDIGVSETGADIGESLQLSGMGSMAGDFTWNESSAESPGMLNTGQILTCPTSCAISDVSISKVSACMNSGGPSTFTANITVTFAVAPTTGTLDLTGDAIISVPVTDICGNQFTFPNVEMTADGGAIDISAAFSDDAGCSFTGTALGMAPFPCCPIDAICQDVMVLLPPMGEIELDGADFDGGTIGCNPFSFSVAPMTVSCADLGNLTVTLTITDVNSGNSDQCTSNLEVNATDEPIACNDMIQVSLTGEEDGCSLVNADMVLEGVTTGCYTLERVPALVGDCSVAPFGEIWVNCVDVGQEVTVRVTNIVTGNSCWSTVNVEDKWTPELVCDGPFDIDCTEDFAALPLPIANDNCDNLTPFVVRTIDSGAECAVRTLTITYQATDSNGNLSNQCERIININPVTDVMFPEDIEWSCTQFGNFPNIIDATELDNAIDPEDASDETSATRLSRTGSGEPNVVGLNNQTCRFTVTYQDQVLEACTGVSTDITFKLVRTWTVLNWCTGEVMNQAQVIEVIDTEAPSITVDNTDIGVNETIVDGPHSICGSSGLIPAPSIIDECSGVSEIRVFTPTGEATAETDANGAVIGFSIPFPYLEIGTHEIVFRAIDQCGNLAEETFEFNVVDATLPVPICREFTQVSLTSGTDGIATVSAASFDEGSFDDCGTVSLKVRRLDSSCPGFGGDQSNFNDEVNFCCEDLGTNVMVVLRVYDQRVPAGSISQSQFEDRANECMIEVLVEDKARPDCIAPANVTTNCSAIPGNFDFSDSDLLDDIFGAARYIDNCGATVTSTVTNRLDNCGVGTLIRNFRVTDDNGNTSFGACRQTITVQDITDYCINIPTDFEGFCTNSNIPAELTFVENGCDLLSISVEENELLAGSTGDECKGVIRTWSLINWCEYDGVSAATVLPRASFTDRERSMTGVTICSDGTNLGRLDVDGNILPDFASTGFYTYNQNVVVFDDLAPEIVFTGDTKFCGGDMDEDPCTAQVDLELEVNDLCTSSITTDWEITAFSDVFTTTDFQGNGSISQRFPIGTHTARFTVTDDCGNVSLMDITFTTVDCKAPTPVCHNGLSIDVMPLAGMVDIWAVDFDASSFDFCNDFELRLNIIEDLNGDGMITPDDYQRTLPDNNFATLTCDNVNQPTMVQLWVAEQDGDIDDGCAGNQDNDFCVTFIEVQDNNGVCGGSRTVGGKVATEDNEATEQVELIANNGGSLTTSLMTTSTGEFQFNLPLSQDYTLTPRRNDDVYNGVSTFDLLLISKHILNVDLLNSPYKVLAADANRSGSVSTLDLVAIRKVILRESNSFPNNTSWRFVSNSQVFTNVNNPWLSPIEEVANFNNLTLDHFNVDFVAIKVGDVNGDVRANNILGVEGRSFNGTLDFEAAEQTFESGEEVSMTISSRELTEVNGYQFTIEFDAKTLSLKDINYGEATAENFGLSQAAKGYITVSWNGTANSEEAFTLVFEAKGKGSLSSTVAINSALTKAEAYTGTDYRNVNLGFGSTATTAYELYQNTPNPFKGETVIGFNMASAASATMTISDVSGKVLKVVRGDYAAGYNTITVSSDELSTGVLYYQLDTDNFSQTMKMVVIK